MPRYTELLTMLREGRTPSEIRLALKVPPSVLRRMLYCKAMLRELDLDHELVQASMLARAAAGRQEAHARLSTLLLSEEHETVRKAATTLLDLDDDGRKPQKPAKPEKKAQATASWQRPPSHAAGRPDAIPPAPRPPARTGPGSMFPLTPFIDRLASDRPGAVEWRAARGDIMPVSWRRQDPVFRSPPDHRDQVHTAEEIRVSQQFHQARLEECNRAAAKRQEVDVKKAQAEREHAAEIRRAREGWTGGKEVAANTR